MRTCPICGWAAIVDSNMYCYRDGAALVEAAVCSNCAHQLSPVDKYCTKCGKKVAP